MMQPDRERRCSPRVPVDYTVYYHYLAPNRNKTKMLDLSVEGAGLEALDSFPIGSKTSFILVMSGEQTIDCQAHVMYVNPCPDGTYRTGVCFLNLTGEGRRMVTQAVQLGSEVSIGRFRLD